MKTITIKLTFIVIFLSSILVTRSQDWDPGWVGGAYKPEEPMTEYTFSFNPAELPEEVDNSLLIYMPPVGYQSEVTPLNDCGCWAESWYTFAYEVNRLKNVSGAQPENWYNPLYTYNMLNEGLPITYTYIGQGWDMIQRCGIPNFDVFDDPALNYPDLCYKYWMSGYDRYISGLNNRITDHGQISWTGNFDDLKDWLAYHGNEEETGGLAIIAVTMGGTAIQYSEYIIGPTTGLSLITHWGDPNNGGFGHALTIVGYNDNAVFDLNGNSQLEPDEYGAFKVVNSWGTGWFDQGYVFVPYKLMTEPGMQAEVAYVCHVQYDYEPQVIIKTKVQYDQARTKLTFRAGWAENASFVIPPMGHTHDYFPAFYNQGGYEFLQGINDEPIEIVLDFGYWYAGVDFGKLFFQVKEDVDNGNVYDGYIESMSLIDYRWNTEFELPSEESNLQLINGSFTNMPIDYDLIPHESTITTNLTLSTDMVSRFTPIVALGATLTVEDGVNIDMYNSEIHIETLSSLVVEDNVTFTAKRGICKVIVNGNATFGSNIQFIAEGDAQIWLEINNTTLNLSLNSAVFENGVIIAYNNQLTLNNPTFTDGGFYGFNGSFDIIGGQFNHSFAHFRNASSDNKVIHVNGSTFTYNSSSTTAIDINNYPNFRLDNNFINGFSGGINLYNCGYGTSFQQISYCDIFDNTNCGITLYRSSVDILHNSITGNGYGIKCLDRCSTHIEGDHELVTQEIMNNRWNEVYATRGSFPQYFHWNLINDNIYSGYSWIRYTGSAVNLDVTRNCWGSNFNPLIHLVPSGAYILEPVWICNTGGGSGSGASAEVLYSDARESIESGEYIAAKSDLEQIVAVYTETEYAKAAMKELYTLEELTGDNYSSLKEYYNTHTAIQSDPELKKLADFLANFCDIKLENWPTAISWFEDVIQNPESLEDSIFAIIDLGYTYFLMEKGQKSSYNGNMPQYKPVSVEQFEEHRDYLLSLLPGDKLSETMKENINALKTGELLQNVPNPFNGTTQIWYKLDEDAVVTVSVFDYTGKRVSTLDAGRVDKGSHFIEFSSVGLPASIYFYCLEVNGRPSDSKKMTVMR